MRPDRPSASLAAFHASAVAIGRQGLLIVGRSGSGKSRLAYALVAASSPRLPVVLIGDDRILLRRDADGRLWARPHPRIAGFIERRGLGLVAMAWREPVALGALLRLDDEGCLAGPDFHDLPQHAAPASTVLDDTGAVITWWRRAVRVRQGGGKGSAVSACNAKDWNW